MQFSVKGNPNYCATIVQIDNKIDLEGCNNIQGAIIFGNHVIISKDTEIGTIGIYFPIECSIKDIFLKANNLYRDKTLNQNQEKSGFFELNGRVRCMKLRGFKSEGFFIPTESLNFLFKDIKDLPWDEYMSSLTNNKIIEIGTEFDHIDNVMICEKYVVKSKEQKQQNSKKDKKNKKIKRFSKLIDDQFRFHIDTSQLGKNIFKINPNSLLSITSKIHGSSFIVSNILCKKKLNFKDKIAKIFKINVIETEYDQIYSSRKVIKNQYLCDNPKGFYDEDIWGIVAKELNPFLNKGMTIYGEVVGYLSSGKMIQKGYDYGCLQNKHDIYIYRITQTNVDGVVYEFSIKQVIDWCKEKGIKSVPSLYYGYAKDLFPELNIENHWHENFLKALQEKYLEKKCSICKNDVWDEGIVLRIECNDIESYKLKSHNFLQYETKILDSGEINIEDNQESE